MQDIHTIGGGGGGRLYGAAGGGDRRLRPHHHQILGGQSPKCPRCDSANTKFCYYNNYNLSQPRHFCKACRRYWTKGGVLRNVPVGGGCRKTKRSSSSAAAKAKSVTKSNNSQSSSDSSSLTAPVPPPEVASASAPRIFNFSQAELRPNFDPMPSSSGDENPSFALMTSSSAPANPSLVPMPTSSGPSLSSDIYSGSFTRMMTSSSDPMVELNFGGDQILVHQQWSRHQPATTTMPEDVRISGGFLDPMAQIDLSGRHNSELGALDHELFDLTGTVDQGYWVQQQWNDLDHSLYLP